MGYIWMCLMLALTLGLSATSAHAQAPSYVLTEKHTEVRLGETPVEIVTHRADAKGLTYVNLHDDENTAVEAALDVIRMHGGRLVEIRHTGVRNVSFELGGTTYTFDPNRIFTDQGAAASLKKLGPFSEGALAETHRFARELLEQVGLDTLDLVVTVHNNTEANYSAESYAEGGLYAREAAAAQRVPRGDPDDFFFVTTRALFEKLAGGNYPVVFQDNARMTDDGSFSVYCGLHGGAYVNVEAQHRHRKAQQRMLEYLIERLIAP